MTINPVIVVINGTLFEIALLKSDFLVVFLKKHTFMISVLLFICNKLVKYFISVT